MPELTVRDRAALSSEFFVVLEYSDDFIFIKSLSTNHVWKIIICDSYVDLYHSHRQGIKLHYQTSCLDVYNAILYILDHDDFHLNHRNRLRRFDTASMLFNLKLMSEYGLQ